MTFPCEKYGRIHLGVNCIDCALVEQVEARVREVYESSDDYMLGIAVGMHNGWLEGHTAALDAARDDLTARIDREVSERDGDGLLDGLRYAVECISKLGEKP